MIRSVTTLALGLALAVAASGALFATIQNCMIYVAAVRGQFYALAPGPSPFLGRVTTSIPLLRFAVWPCLIFVLLQSGSGYALSTLFQVVWPSSQRRWQTGFFASLATTVLCLAGIWTTFARKFR